MSTTLVRTPLHNSVAESVYNEVLSRTGKYYYFLGRPLSWSNVAYPPEPIDSISYERDTRNNIILVKYIQPGDVSFVVDRIDWQANTVYDIYDDEYSDQLIGIDLSAGGLNYSNNPTVTIQGGGGVGAKANAVVTNGRVTSVIVTDRGRGYTAAPNVIISDNFGSGAVADAVLNYSYSGASDLQSALYYVVTDDFNIYKCLDNNNNAKSTVKPVEVSPEAFTTADGYKWKYLGNIPISLRNKFLTTAQIPVATAVSDQFYSDGEIKFVDIANTGNNYTYASIVVQGDGYLEDDPYFVVRANVNNSGSGYTTATVVIDPPITGATPWAASTVFSVGQFISFENNIYEVVKTGTTASFGPVHTKGTVANGTVNLKFRGTGLTANANINGSGNIVGLTDFYAGVRDIIITNGGSGYLAPPVVTITGGGGANANAYCSISRNNSVTRVYVTDSGKNYTGAPTVAFGEAWQANTTYSLNTQVAHSTRLYTVTGAGTSNTTAPTHTFGNVTLGTAEFTYAGTRATGYATIRYGAGYQRAPKVTITGDGANANIELQVEKSEAIMYPIIEDGRITRVEIHNGGIGYTYATLTPEGDGSDAEFLVNFTEGKLNTLQGTSEILSVDGAIHTIQVVSGGYGYQSANVIIDGDGSGATATATVISGRVVKINVVTEGAGYTTANVIITSDSGSGAGAVARAILPPVGGHGRNVVDELGSRSLGFYTTIARERNQGFVVTNDYRQFGIIKNVRNYDNNKFFSGDVGSTCWLLSGNVNTTLFTQDTDLTRTTDGGKFIVVSSDATGLLAISSDGSIPAINDVLREPSGNTFTVIGVTEPDADKYSGQLLYIDNRLAFTTTEDQAVSIKTVFKY